MSAWLTEWERRGPKWEKARARVLSTMETIAAQPNGFVQGSGLYDLDTGRFAVAAEPVVGVSHLSAVFGLNELCAELIDLVDMPAFKEAYLDYCRYFNATKAEQAARYGSNFGTLLLFQGHSRLDAYAAVQTGDATLATRAWTKFYTSDGYTESAPWKTETAERPGHPRPGQRGQLGVHQRHRALRPRRHREPRTARRQDALVTEAPCPSAPRDPRRGAAARAHSPHGLDPLPLPHPVDPARPARRVYAALERAEDYPAGGPRCARSPASTTPAASSGSAPSCRTT